jgi:uncharacterized membrane protein YfcA
MTQNFLYLLLGLIAGTFSGLIGIGGGTIIVPALIFLFGMSQHLAQGTTLALLVPPIGFLAAWTYYKQGDVDLRIAALSCAGFCVGGLLGAKFAQKLSNVVLERVFGVALLLISLKMMLPNELFPVQKVPLCLPKSGRLPPPNRFVLAG